MSLLSFNPLYRRMWMFPRNIRDINPWKLCQIMKVLADCSDFEFKDNRDQKYIYAMLEDSGIKRPSKTKDINPGGMRTYYAQLVALGLIYEGSKKEFHYTIAGRELSEGRNPQKVLQYQLLRHQYPSIYSFGRNVMIDPRINVKPFVFILEMLQDIRLSGYLTCSEIIVPVLYGHNSMCLDTCIRKIVRMRKNEGAVESVIDNYTIDLYTPRSGMGKNLNNAKDIANTAKNYLEAVGLIVKLGEKQFGEQKYSFNRCFEEVFEQLKNEPFIRCDETTDKETFQRSYGRYESVDDTLSQDENLVGRESPDREFIQFRYALYANNNPFYSDSDFYDEMRGMNMKMDFVAEAIKPYVALRHSIDRNNFLELATSSGTKKQEYKLALVNLFQSLGYMEEDGIPDIPGNQDLIYLLFENVSTGERCLVVASDLGNYSLVQEDIPCQFNFNKPQYCLVIAGGFKGDVGSSVEEVTETTGIPVTAMKAKTLVRAYELEKEKKESDNESFSFFKKTGYITGEEAELIGGR